MHLYLVKRILQLYDLIPFKLIFAKITRDLHFLKVMARVNMKYWCYKNKLKNIRELQSG